MESLICPIFIREALDILLLRTYLEKSSVHLDHGLANCGLKAKPDCCFASQEWFLVFLHGCILNGCLVTSVISSILPLSLQRSKYLLSRPLQKKRCQPLVLDKETEVHRGQVKLPKIHFQSEMNAFPITCEIFYLFFLG